MVKLPSQSLAGQGANRQENGEADMGQRQAPTTPPAAQWLVLATVVLAFLALALYRLGGHSLWLDEIMAVHFTEGGPLNVLQAVGADVHSPVYYLLLWAFRQTGQFSEFVVRLPGVLAGALTLIAVFLLARRLHAPRAGLWACALLSVSPFFLQYSREVHPYSLSALLVALSYLGFVSVIQHGRWRDAALYGAACALLFLTFYLAAFALLPQLLLGFHPKIALRKRYRLWLGWAVAALLVAPWLQTFGDQLKRDNAGTLASFPDGIKVEHVLQSIREPLFGAHAPLAGLDNRVFRNIGSGLAIALFSLAALALWRDRRRLSNHERRIGRLIGCALAIAYFAFLLLCLKKPLLVPRYLTMLAPLIALVFAAAISRLRSAGTWPLFGVYLVIALPAYHNYQQALPTAGEDWKGAVHALKQEAAPSDLLVASNGNTVNCLAFYLRKVDEQSWEERIANWEQFQGAASGYYTIPDRTMWFFMRDNPTEQTMLEELKTKNRYGGAIPLKGVFSLHRFHAR